jgi:hypothetical protein
MSPATRYRFAAVVFACITLLLSICAAPARAQTDRSSELQSLVNDLGYQLDLVEQFDRHTAERRLQLLAIALDRWNTSSRSQSDFQAMQQWLETSIQASMPGRSKPMPELPWFSERLARSERVASRESMASPESIAGSESGDRPAPPTTAGPDSEPAAARTPVVPKAEFSAVPPDVEAPEPAGSVASAWQRHPAAKPIDLGNPFFDDAPLTARTTATPRIALRPSTLNVQPASAKVNINVAELAARIRGYVHGLRGVEARLLASPDIASDQLLMAVRELKQLAAQREFVSLYLEALSPADRARTPDLPSEEHAKAIAAQRMERLRETGQLTAAAEETMRTMLQDI